MGWLEIVTVIAIIIMLIAGFVSMSYVIGQQVRQAARDRQADRDRVKIEQIAISTRAALAELRAAIAAGPNAQSRAMQQLLDGIEELQRRQTQVIIQEQRRREVVVVVVSPEPQPTATVTCDPTPVVGSCRRGGGR